MINIFESIKENKKLNTVLMQECDIYFYEQSQETNFSSNQEVYSMSYETFAQDGSGGEFVFLDDGSIGFISSEGEVGRIAENLEELMTFLIYAGNIFDFNCRFLYQNQSLLKKYCDGYLLKIRESYKTENRDWDMVRLNLAKELSLPFEPDKLAEQAMNFYQAATDGENEYICDSVLSDIVGLWVAKLTGMSKEEIENSSKKFSF